MAPNFDPYHRLRQRVERWDAGRRFNMFHELRRRLYRSRQGKVLGVFRGIAESMGFCVFWTRVIGCFILLTLTNFFGAHGLMVTLLVAGFFYLLVGMLMQAPRNDGGMTTSTANPANAENLPPLSRTRYGGSYSASAAYQEMRPRPKIDLAQLDQQLDRLNHRIQHMETIVTDRQYDWQRRLDS